MILLGLAAAIAAVGLIFYLAPGFEFEADEPSPAPRIVIEETAPEEAPELGFPAFATKNTTRVAGDDPVADAAGVALATSPATGGVEGPAAVSLVNVNDWAAGVAAAALVAAPVGAPILLSETDEVPDLTLSALTALAPQGSSETADAQLFRLGDAAAPRGLRVREIEGATPAELAADVARLRTRLTGEDPDHVLLASSDQPEFAMPAAAWAARSGDPVLFVQADSVPRPTLQALERLGGASTYLLGPESVISADVEDILREETGSRAKRVGAEDPVDNAVAFARYADGTFGWEITDPGHGLVFANSSRPADAGAAAPLSASGKWGPLLLVDDPDVLPPAVEGFLLDIKPGYVDDPTRAIYNHGWMIGDADAVSVAVQAQIDELLELVEVQSGDGLDRAGLQTGRPESQPDTDSDQDGDDRGNP